MILPFMVTIGSAENHDTTVHIMTDPLRGLTVIVPVPHGQPARGYIHFHLQPMREHPHSSQQCISFLSHEENRKPLLPDSIVTANSLHATSQTEKSTKAKPNITDFIIWD
ncbi:hypothetical protein TNCV_4070481 [Trichonephila clavipes]|nr:hypothetical protein TNCV_4070481 [Trichonephila clavipes]